MPDYTLDHAGMEMTSVILAYTAGPGFDGFAAFLDQWIARIRTECRCGQKHDLPPVDISIVRGNLDRLKASVEGALAS
jgi:hypothetical protein